MYPAEQVEGGIRKYLEKGYAVEGKGEAYLLGIIRSGNNGAKKADDIPSLLVASSPKALNEDEIRRLKAHLDPLRPFTSQARPASSVISVVSPLVLSSKSMISSFSTRSRMSRLRLIE